MKVINKLTTKPYITIYDLEKGDIFVFITNDNIPCINIGKTFEPRYVELTTGEMFTVDDDGAEYLFNIPVKKVKATITIEEEDE